MLKNSNFDNELTLSPSEINDYYQEGFVVKDKVFNDNDFISFREGITKSIQNKCDNLINDGKLDSDFSEEPFEKRLVKIYDHNPKAAHEILMSIWSGKFHGSGILDALRHEKLINCIQKIIGPNIIATSIYRIRPKLPNYPLGEVPWHQDVGYSLPHCDKYKIVTCWIPLIDSNIENGCIWLIPKAHKNGVIRHYTEGHSGYLEISPEDLPKGAIPIEIKKGSVLFMTSKTPHASFINKSKIVRWSIDLRYQDFNVPNNINESPEDYLFERNIESMACNPTEAYFVIKDIENPDKEMKDYYKFSNLRKKWENKKISVPQQRWTPLSKRYK